MKQFSTSPTREIGHYSDFLMRKNGKVFITTIRRREDLARVFTTLSLGEAQALNKWLTEALSKYEEQP